MIPVYTNKYMTKTTPYRLPRTKLKTKSLRKAYNRVRRASPIVYLESPSDDFYMVNGCVLMRPAWFERFNKKLAEHFQEEYFGTIGEIKVECEPRACCTMDGVTVEGIKSAMEQLSNVCAPAILDKYAFPADMPYITIPVMPLQNEFDSFANTYNRLIERAYMPLPLTFSA